MKKKLSIAIDGPSGAGIINKSTPLNRELGYVNIDTGAMYRSIALLAGRKGISLDDASALQRLCAGLDLEFRRDGEEEKVFVNGEDVSRAIRAPEVSMQTSQVAACREVRETLVNIQQQMGAQGGVVLEGRDIGTVVFPQAEVKFFLSASAEERGRRRYVELNSKGVPVDLEQTIAEVRERDAADSSREHAPLRRAEDAIDIDSTTMDIEQVKDLMISLVKKKL